MTIELWKVNLKMMFSMDLEDLFTQMAPIILDSLNKVCLVAKDSFIMLMEVFIKTVSGNMVTLLNDLKLLEN